VALEERCSGRGVAFAAFGRRERAYALTGLFATLCDRYIMM